MKKIIAITAVSTVALFMGANSASAHWPGWGGNGVIVTNHNDASILNVVSAESNTGFNSADGGNAGGAGSGGSVVCSDDGNTGGNGGSGGDAGAGGAVYTGSAVAVAGAENYANSNDTAVVDNCCEDDSDTDKVRVHNSNYVDIMNFVYSGANTGMNSADGGNAGGAGSGGDVMCSDDANTGGNGGSGGDAGNAGEVRTGYAYSDAYAVNNANSNDTKVVDNCCEDDDCDCCDDDCCDDMVKCDRTIVHNSNGAFVENDIYSAANTGMNSANGGNAGGAGSGGDVTYSDDDNAGGKGGNGGNAGAGGAVYSGPAESYAGSVTVVNSNVTRIRK